MYIGGLVQQAFILEFQQGLKVGLMAKFGLVTRVTLLTFKHKYRMLIARDLRLRVLENFLIG